ncbi:MAG: hypothetical protein IIY78_01515 [Clostridia bacterium]|nr:hypothetical protein [Clostridia bacterium]
MRRRLPLTIQLDGTWERRLGTVPDSMPPARLVEGRKNVERGEGYR